MSARKDRVFERHARSVEIGGKFGLFDKFGRGFLALGAKLVGDLLGAAFFFKEFAFCFRRAAFGFGRSIWVADDGVDDGRVLNQKLLIERDKFNQQAVLRCRG